MFKASLKNLGRHSKGFSLVEVLVAMVIILVLVAAITPLLVFNSQTSRYNTIKATAKNLANEKVEAARALKFADVGVEGSNPGGKLKALETLNIDGSTYAIKTYVNWEDQGSCLKGEQASWDVKLLRVEVVGESYLGSEKKEVRETIETLIARDFEQPLLQGANIRICVFKGWDYEVSSLDNAGEAVEEDKRTYIPMEGVRVQIEGPQTSTVFSTSAGSALFVNIDEGSYDLEASKPGLMVRPGTFDGAVVAVENSTFSQQVFVEKPASLALRFIDSEGEPLFGVQGSVELATPFGSSLKASFHSTDADGYILPSPLFDQLWPHPAPAAGGYGIDAIKIDNYEVTIIEGARDIVTRADWDGYFESPGQHKTVELTLTLEEAEEVGEPNKGPWIDRQGKIVTDFLPQDRIARLGNILNSGIFERSGSVGAISLASGAEVNFTGSSLAFLGQTLTIESGARLGLMANEITFENEINLKTARNSPTGTIILNTLTTSEYEDNNRYFKILDSKGDVLMIGEQPLLAKKDDLPKIFEGSVIEGSDLAKHYGIVEFENNIYTMNARGRQSKIIDSGKYYFPDGFNLASGTNGLIDYYEINP